MRPIVLSILLGATFGLAAAAVTVARDAWRDIDEAQASILFRGEDMGLERTLTTDYEADDHSHFQEVPSGPERQVGAWASASSLFILAEPGGSRPASTPI